MKKNIPFLIVLFFFLQGTIAFGQTYIYEDLEKENITGYSKIVSEYFYFPFKGHQYTRHLENGKITKAVTHIRGEKRSEINSTYDEAGNHMYSVKTYDHRRGGETIDTLPKRDDNYFNRFHSDKKNQVVRRSSGIYDEEAKTGWCVDYTYNNEGLLVSEYTVRFRNGVKETEKTTYSYDKHNNISEITRESTPDKWYPQDTSHGKEYRYEKFEYDYVGDIWVRKYWQSSRERKQLRMQLLVRRELHK